VFGIWNGRMRGEVGSEVTSWAIPIVVNTRARAVWAEVTRPTLTDPYCDDVDSHSTMEHSLMEASQVLDLRQDT